MYSCWSLQRTRPLPLQALDAWLVWMLGLKTYEQDCQVPTAADGDTSQQRLCLFMHVTSRSEADVVDLLSEWYGHPRAHAQFSSA
jgi:hypothetical protein